MKTRKFIKICSTICSAALLIAMTQAVAFAAEEKIDLDTVRPGDSVEITDENNDYTTVRVQGNLPIDENYAMTTATPSAPYADTIYNFDDIPDEWIIPIRKDSKTVGYYVIVPGGFTRSFRISGTDFETVQKMEEIKYGDPIELSDGKARTFYHVNAIKLTLR